MNNKEIKVLLIHNYIAPYRIPLFEELNRSYDLTVLFCKKKSIDRFWKTSLEGYTFKNRILLEFDIGLFHINPTIPIHLITRSYDVYIIGDNVADIFSSVLTIIAARLFKKPIILWSGCIDNPYLKEIYCEDKFLKRTLRKMYISFTEYYRRTIFPKMDAFIAYSRKTRLFLIRRGAKKESIFIGGQITPSQILGKGVFKKHKLLKNKKVILFLGYLQKRKGVEYLIKAYKKMDRKDCILIIAGSGPDESRLKLLAKDEKGIYFVGYVEGEEKANIYSIADIFASPTIHDPSSHVINEAMYYGLPIITTNADGASEKINGNGFIVPPRNIDKLKTAMTKLINNQSLIRRMSFRSIKLSKKYTDIGSGTKPFRYAIDKSLCLYK